MKAKTYSVYRENEDETLVKVSRDYQSCADADECCNELHRLDGKLYKVLDENGLYVY